MSGCPTGLPYSVSAVLRSTGFRRWLLESSEGPYRKLSRKQFRSQFSISH